jgi:hypothetical protein
MFSRCLLFSCVLLFLVGCRSNGLVDSSASPDAGAAMITTTQILSAEIVEGEIHSDNSPRIQAGSFPIGLFSSDGWDGGGYEKVKGMLQPNQPLFFTRANIPGQEATFPAAKVKFTFAGDRVITVSFPGYSIDDNGRWTTQDGTAFDRRLYIGEDGRSYFDAEGKKPAI